MLAEIETLNGLPAHPLLVHLPVVVIPLALGGAVLALAIGRWRSWLAPLTAAFAALGLVGVQLAVMSGEGLEELTGEGGEAAIERHAELAEQARPLVLLFVLAAGGAALLVHLLRREGDPPARAATLRKLLAPVLALSVLTGVLSTVWIYRTGHSGAESVWKDEGDSTDRHEDGGSDRDDHEERDADGGDHDD